MSILTGIKTDKIWGVTELMIGAPNVEVHRLDIKSMHRCSLHLHRRKWNAFAVISGRLFIDVAAPETNRADGAAVTTVELGPGDLCTVAPGDHHMFRTGAEPCRALEIYYTDPLAEDIERRDQGGPIDA